MIRFSKKNLVSCYNVSIRRVITEYIFWTLAGKPNHYKIKEKSK